MYTEEVTFLALGVRTLLAYQQFSQLYRRKKGGLVTESLCWKSSGIVLIPGSASDFNCEYLMSPYVRVYLFVSGRGSYRLNLNLLGAVIAHVFFLYRIHVME